MTEPHDTDPRRPDESDLPEAPAGLDSEEELADPEAAPAPILESDPEGRPTI